MEQWPDLFIAAVMVLAIVFAVLSIRHARSRPADVVLRIDTSNDPNVPLAIVNAGRDPVFELEATLRFEGRATRPQQLMERHRRALVLLPGERLGFPLPEDGATQKATQHATLVRRVRLDAVARDPKGRPVQARDLLEDPMAWIESERRSRSAVHTSPPRKDGR
jgi:hypothetical protein